MKKLYKFIILKTKIILLAVLFSSFAVFSQKKWTLKECVKYALENNIIIKKNKLNLQLAKKGIAIAKGNFLPNLNASMGGNLNAGLSRDKNGILKNTNNFNSSFNLSAGGTIFNGFRNLNSQKQAELGLKGSQLDLEKIENDISLNVVNSYLNVLFAKENLKVAEVQSEISKKQIESAKAKFNAGVIPKGNLLNIQSTASKDIQNTVIQQNTLDLALLNLSQLLQVPNKEFDILPIKVDSPSTVLLYDNADKVYRKALTNRPEIKRAELNIESSNLGIKIAKGAFSPTLSYSASAGTSYFDQLNNLLPEQSNSPFFKQVENRFTYGGGLSLSIPIFNRFQTKNNVDKSIINKKSLEITLESQKLQLQQTIEKAFLDAKAAAKTYEAAQISLKAQNEAFKNAQESYNYGSMTIFDFDQVRNRLVNAEGAMIRAKYDYVFKTKVLKFYFRGSIIE